LIWQAHETGLPVATILGSLTNFGDATTKNIHFDYDLGFRVGAGYNMAHDEWDLNLTWLRFYTDGQQSH